MTKAMVEHILNYENLLLVHIQLLSTEKEYPRLNKMYVDVAGQFKLDQRTPNEVGSQAFHNTKENNLTSVPSMCPHFS